MFILKTKEKKIYPQLKMTTDVIFIYRINSYICIYIKKWTYNIVYIDYPKLILIAPVGLPSKISISSPQVVLYFAKSIIFSSRCPTLE